jgi:hypothetical protein
MARVSPLVGVLVAGSAAFYVAQVPSYGCSSRAEVVKLQRARSDMPSFQRLLTEQVAYGQCVTIPRGAEVEASSADAGSSTLLVNARTDPPGYVVPLADFKPK